MPIFMDRHDLSKSVNSENVAHLHQEDLKIQDEFNCRGITYWFDASTNMAFCLIEAPNIESVFKMHTKAHGEVPNHVIEVDKITVELFLGRIQNPDSTHFHESIGYAESVRRTMVVCRFKSISLKGINKANIQVLQQKVIHPLIELVKKFEGNFIESKNDFTLISFKAAINAIQFSLELQEKYADNLDNRFKFNFEFKIGITSGMPVDNTTELFKETVKTAFNLSQMEITPIIISSDLNYLLLEHQEELNSKDYIHFISSSDQQFIINTFNYLELNFKNSDLKLEDIEVELGMCKSKLYRNFIRLMGLSPNQLLKEYRLNKALNSLIINTQTISETAYENGFSGLAYFSKCFKKRFHIVPSTFMKV